MSFTDSHSTSPAIPHYWLSTFDCWAFSVAGPTVWNSLPDSLRNQQQLQTITADESISLLPLSTHSAVEMLHDTALYKSIIDIDTVTDIAESAEEINIKTSANDTYDHIYGGAHKT